MNPKSENILKVIQVFKSVLPLAKRSDHLDMKEYRVFVNFDDEKHACGTVHCHAGWFMIGAAGVQTECCGFIGGIGLLVEHLGLSSEEELKEWASDKVIWGNHRGYAMFSEKDAFTHPTKRPNGALNLQHIIDHWTEVYERVKALEEKETPQPQKEELYKDITRELSVLPEDKIETDIVVKVNSFS